MTTTQRLALIACALLISSGLAVNGPGSAPPDARRESGADRYERLRLRLVERNPRLDDVLSGRIIDATMRCERVHDLAADLVLAVMLRESDGRPHVRSRAGALGLMQVMPHMFEQLDLPGGLAHIETNVEAGCILLADNIRRLGEDRGVSAYYWGSGIRDDRYLRGVRRMQEFLAQRGAGDEWGA